MLGIYCTSVQKIDGKWKCRKNAYTSYQHIHVYNVPMVGARVFFCAFTMLSKDQTKQSRAFISVLV